MNDGPEVALALLSLWVQQDTQIRATCHTLAHIIGQESAKVLSVEEALRHEPGTCLNGYMHGVLQTYATSGSEFDLSNATAACAGVDEMYADACAHGLGHLLTVRFPNDIGAALTRCLALEEIFVGRCAGGVAMEFGQNFLSQQHGNAFPGISRTMGPDGPVAVSLSETELENPCATLGQSIWAYECWTAVAPFWIGTLERFDESGSSSTQLFSWCTRAGVVLREACAYSIGAWMVDPVANDLDREGTWEAAERICGSAPTDLMASCMTGLFLRLGLPRDGEEVLQWCTRWSGAMEDGCVEGVESAFADQARIVEG